MRALSVVASYCKLLRDAKFANAAIARPKWNTRVHILDFSGTRVLVFARGLNSVYNTLPGDQWNILRAFVAGWQCQIMI